MAVARVGWGVLALCGALGLAVFALRHPFGVMAGGAIVVAFVVLMSVRRDAWLLCVPALAPVVDLAGMPAATLTTAMREFKDGKRQATVMHQIAKGLSDEQVKTLADYFAAQKP